MQEAFFECLSNLDLLQCAPADLANIIRKKRRSQLEDIIARVEEVIPVPDSAPASRFTFLANASYSGAPFPCSHFECRAERVRELAHFAGLYADKVWLTSPFSALQDAPNLKKLRYELVFYLTILSKLKPLFDAGLLGITPLSTATICRGCYTKVIGTDKNEFSQRLSRLEESLHQRFLREVEYFVEDRGSKVALIPKGPATLVDPHLRAHVFDSSVPPRLIDFVKSSGSGARLPASLVEELEIPSMMSEEIVDDVLNQNFYASRYGTSYLTHREIELEMAIEMMPDHNLRRRAQVLNTSFSHKVPILNGVKLEDLVRLRRDEGDSFQVYRDALQKTIGNVSGDDPEKFKQAFDDAVLPELNRINAKVTNAKRTLAKDVAVDALAATGFIGLGLFSGILPANIAPVVAALGGYHFVRDATRKLSQLTLEVPDARSSDFYFLWKVQKLSKSINGGESLLG